MFSIIDYDIGNGLYYRLSGSRIAQEQTALGNLLKDLMRNNSGEGNSENVEVSIISFATHRGNQETTTYTGADWGSTEVDWQSGDDTTALLAGVTDGSLAAGTNWEEALKYAKAKMDDKKDSDGPDEDYFIVFLTDGAPTATTWSATVRNYNGAYYGTECSNVYPEGYYEPAEAGGRYRRTCEPAYQDARDDALALVNAGYKLYNIYTYGAGTDIDYMRRLTNYAYTNGANDTNGSTEYLDKYFTNATDTGELVKAFQNIFSQIAVEQSHVQVKITDGIRQDAMTSTFVNDKPSGVTYTVAPKDTPDTPIYTVTATVPENSDEPIVTFKIGDNEYSTEDNQVVKHVKEPVDNDPLASYDAGTYYSVTVDDVEYKMALATVVPTEDENVSTLTWNLSPIGMLMRPWQI